MILFLFRRSIHPNSVRRCLDKGEKVLYWQCLTVRHRQEYLREEWHSWYGLSLIMSPVEHVWDMLKQRIYRRENNREIRSNSTRLCSKHGTIFHKGIVLHQMSIQWVAYVVKADCSGRIHSILMLQKTVLDHVLFSILKTIKSLFNLNFV